MTTEIKYNFAGDDFCKSLLYYKQSDSLFCLTENNKLVLFSNQLKPTYTAQCETVLYQATPYDPNTYVLSCKDMPIRIMSMCSPQINNDSQTSATNCNSHTCVGIIVDKKQNSEKYLAPISMQTDNNILYAGGKLFLGIYDLPQCKLITRLKHFDKKYISTIEVLQDQVLVAGEFSGALHLVSCANSKDVQTINCHIDAITGIAKHPSDANYFVSAARNDDFKYLWDCRNTSKFVQVYHLPKFLSNQRIGFDFDASGGVLISGSPDGHLLKYEVQTGKLVSKEKRFDVAVNCIASLRNEGGKIVISSGERVFGEDIRGGIMQFAQ